MRNHLLPIICPFCGNLEVSVFTPAEREVTWYVRCGMCGASVPGTSAGDAVRVWNSRWKLEEQP